MQLIAISILVIYSIIISLLFFKSANDAGRAVMSEAILYNTLKAESEKYHNLREIFVRYEASNQIKPLKRDVEDFFNIKEKDINKKLSKTNKEFIDLV